MASKQQNNITKLGGDEPVNENLLDEIDNAKKRYDVDKYTKLAYCN